MTIAGALSKAIIRGSNIAPIIDLYHPIDLCPRIESLITLLGQCLLRGENPLLKISCCKKGTRRRREGE